MTLTPDGPDTTPRLPAMPRLAQIEWPTVALAVGCYAVWATALLAPVPFGIILAALAVALHSSLCHEAIHGHPTRSRRLNEALVWPAVALLIPYGRFRDTHLAHHTDDRLTDPYDDPESNYLARADWERLGPAARTLRRINNTLAGRIVLGPLIGQACFMMADWRLAQGGAGPETAREVRRAWAAHLPAAALVLAVVWAAPLPVWAYLAAVWAGLGLVKVRTFLEHQAEQSVGNRTVIVEDRGPLALLFLNNNLHAVHHARPGVPWYRLPGVYRADRARYLGANGGYCYRSYAQVARRYLWRAKDPVDHPFLRR